jgi:hypothetical protein
MGGSGVWHGTFRKHHIDKLTRAGRLWVSPRAVSVTTGGATDLYALSESPRECRAPAHSWQ